MGAERGGEIRRPVALASAAQASPAAELPGNGMSLLRLSVPARLSMVAAAATLLWTSVLWALR